MALDLVGAHPHWGLSLRGCDCQGNTLSPWLPLVSWVKGHIHKTPARALLTKGRQKVPGFDSTGKARSEAQAGGLCVLGPYQPEVMSDSVRAGHYGGTEFIV